MFGFNNILKNMDEFFLIPSEIEFTKVPTIEESRKACRDNIAAAFMRSCEAISPAMAEDFRREQEEQKEALQNLLDSLTTLQTAMEKEAR